MISRLSKQNHSNVGPGRNLKQTPKKALLLWSCGSVATTLFVESFVELPMHRSRSIPNHRVTTLCRQALGANAMIPPLLRLRPAMSSTFSNVNTTIPSANEMPPPSYTVHGTMLPDECADTNWDFQRDHLYRAQNSCLAWSFGAQEPTNESRSEVRA
jgi:hypothetical protein